MSHPTSERGAVRARATAGDVLREWRRRRQLSQLALALEAGVSQRHVSFIESGRTQPSREMVLRLAERLHMPLRERNRWLLAAGYAPVFAERSLDAPEMQAVRDAVSRVLEGHAPYPALAIDRHWHLVMANAAVPPLLAGVSPALLEPPVNVLRLSLHPEGLAPRIVNLEQWRTHLLARLAQQTESSGDDTLAALAEELRALPRPAAARRAGSDAPAIATEGAGVFVPLRLRVGDVVLSLISTTTVFGTPVDVTLSELALECFFPADAATAGWLRGVSGG